MGYYKSTWKKRWHRCLRLGLGQAVWGQRQRKQWKKEKQIKLISCFVCLLLLFHSTNLTYRNCAVQRVLHLNVISCWNSQTRNSAHFFPLLRSMHKEQAREKESKEGRTSAYPQTTSFRSWKKKPKKNSLPWTVSMGTAVFVSASDNLLNKHTTWTALCWIYDPQAVIVSSLYLKSYQPCSVTTGRANTVWKSNHVLNLLDS